MSGKREGGIGLKQSRVFVDKRKDCRIRLLGFESTVRYLQDVSSKCASLFSSGNSYSFTLFQGYKY